MVRADAMKTSTPYRIRLGGRLVDYNLVQSKAARKLRVCVGPDGVEVVNPASRSREAASEFLLANKNWVLDQLDRAERLRKVRRPADRAAGQILFRGEPTRVDRKSVV